MRSKQKKPLAYSIKSLDVLGSKFNFTFESKSGKFQTALGGYITLVVGLISTASFIFIMSQYFSRGDPVVTTSKELGPEIIDFNFYHERLFTVFGMATGPFSIKQEDLAKYITGVYTIDEVFFNKTSERLQKTRLGHVYLVPCPSIIGDLVVKEVLFKIAEGDDLQKILVCPDFSGMKEEFFIKRDTTRGHWFRTISLKVFPCSLPDPSQCMPGSRMVALQIQSGRRTRLLVPENYEDPVEDSYYVGNTKIDLSVTKISQRMITKNRALDDTVQFVKPKVRKEYGSPQIVRSDFVMRDPTQLHCSRAQIEQGEGGGCKEYITFDFEPNGELIVTRRNYKKFSTMLGEFGGILKVITTVVFFFYSFYNARKAKNFLKLRMINLTEKSYKVVTRILERYWSRQQALEVQKRFTNSRGGASKKVLDGYLESRSNVVDMMKKLSLLEFVEESLLEDYEKKLLPLVMMLNKQKAVRSALSSHRAAHPRAELPDPSAEAASGSGQRREDSEYVDESFYQNSYEKLLREEPKNYMNRCLRQYLIEKLEGVLSTETIKVTNNQQFRGFEEGSRFRENHSRSRSIRVRSRLQEIPENSRGDSSSQKFISMKQPNRRISGKKVSLFARKNSTKKK